MGVSSAGMPPPRAAVHDNLASVLLLLLLIGLGVMRSSFGTRLDSFTVDEPWHVYAGVVYNRSGDFRLNPEHPPLVKRVAGLAMPAQFVTPSPIALSEKEQERRFVQDAVFLRNDANAAQQRTRLAMWTFHGVLLLAAGLLLWRIFGLAWALGTLAFLAIEPTVGAHLPVVMTDLPLALTLLVAALCGGLLAATWRWRWALACGIALGLALGTKHSALAGVAGIALALLLACVFARGGAHGFAARLARTTLAGLLAWLVLWALYGFHFHAALDGSDPFNRDIAAKLADLSGSGMRDLIVFADHWHLAPRAYLWGLADTVRAGIDGRGISFHLLFGTKFLGDTPWFAWPAILASKVPLALFLLALVGAVSLLRLKLGVAARWTLLVLAAVAAAHLAALLGSRGIWGGVRHALPLLVLLSIPAGAAFALAWQQRSRALAAGGGLLVVGALAMTLGEPRLWEYHNEFAGGSRDAWRNFGNEGIDLGQRFGEIRDLYHGTVAPSGEPMYVSYWMLREQAQADGVVYRRRVESIDDDNVDGIYQGWFVYEMPDTVSRPEFGWDAEAAFRDLTLHRRSGFVGLWHGRQTLPRSRANGMYDAIMRYVYEEDGKDWAKVARKLEESVVHIPHHVGAAVELANAYTRLGDGAAAIGALRRVLDQQKVPVDTQVRAQIEAQIERLRTASRPAELALLRNPWME